MKVPRLLSFSLCLLLFSPGVQAEDSGEPILEWKFDDTIAPGVWKGKAGHVSGKGPRAPIYPGHPSDNLAARLSGKDGYLLIKDHEKGGTGNVRFAVGETITLESWVKIESISDGSMAYLLGKGRHGDLGENLPDINQNYAIRLQGEGGAARLGFLFSSIDKAKGDAREWHRWWSDSAVPSSGWHHIALTYTFGKSRSLKAWIDGREVEGRWDMGGATNLPPVTDADDLVIGTGNRRTAGESFSGWIDNLAIYRGELDPEVIRSRYRFNPPPPPVTREMLTDNEVLIQISEKGVPAANHWPEFPEVTETWKETAFGFSELPQQYVSTGVRGDRANPSHFRAAALVNLPAGRHRILLRGRGASRLFIDGEKILETPFPGPDTNGHGQVSEQDEYLDLGPDFRFAPPGNREDWITFPSDGSEHFVILESMIGGIAGRSKRRPEIGELVVALSPEGSKSWQILTPSATLIPYTDESWDAYEEKRNQWLSRTNTAARAEKRSEHAAYWQGRRKAARDWLATLPPLEIPPLPGGMPAHNAIDHFLGREISRASATAAVDESSSVHYFDDIQPLLEAKCYDCHRGGKAQGELRLDLHDRALAGGKSDGPAVTPGDIDRSSLIYRITEDAGDDIMPPKGDPLSKEEIALLTTWIEEGAPWPQFDVERFTPTPLADDLAFLRRLTLDTVGVPPTEAEIETFLAAPEESRRTAAIDQFLDDPRWADQWMGYWQDVLAENPNIINPTLNNTGPFRWWLYESLLDNKPADLFVTELIRMEGSERFGGPAGFGTASQNDVPMAAKGIIITSAFLGVEMKCARCHDAPAHSWKQEDLFQLAALLKKSPIEVPLTSSVPMDRIHQSGREPLIEVTLAPGSEVTPAWPFEQFCSEESARALAENPDDPRDLLAALITAPENERFAQVIANRVWQRLMGRGLVENLTDWEMSSPSHPELLSWLGRELIANNYDLKSLARLILQSHAYQRAIDPTLTETSPLFIAPSPRRLSAEQIVDSLFSATGKPFELEEVSLDIDSVRALNNSLSLGKPRRAWMLASTSNERDRPSLSLPRIQAVSSFMETFGWRGSRQDPVSLRDTEANVLQPAILANGTMGVWLTRLSDDHGVTSLALEDQPLDVFIDRLYLRLLTRGPSPAERDRHREYLGDGYDERIITEADRPKPVPTNRKPVRYVSWSNHVDGPANTLAQEKEAEARAGDPPTTALTDDWRSRLEDVLWAILNAPEWIYSP